MDERRLKFFLALQKMVEESKNLSPKAKEKFYALAEGSIGKPVEDEKLGNDGKDLARMYRETGFVPIDLGDLTISVSDKKKEPKDGARLDLNRHKPIDVTKFLLLFSSYDHPFKYLVHDLTKPGEVFNLSRLLQEVTDKFKLETKNFLIPKSLYSRLEAFIGISQKTWYFKGSPIYFSFYSEKVKEWCSKNPNKHPLLNFRAEIKALKDSIRIEDNLKEIIEFVLAEKGLLTSFDVDFENIGKPNFYTDVDALMSGMGIIFNSIHQRIHHGIKVKFVFEAKSFGGGRLRILKIIHVGSECLKELSIEELFSGDLKEARKYFYQLCDWSIIAKNPNPEINKINILYNPSIGKIPREKTEEPIEGFTHVLTFYS